jgi:uncharacterized integral membrane protein (TIGR00697 family)
MGNETLFFLHVLIVLAFAWGALRLGKAALVGWIAIQATLANLFVMKQMDLFGLTVTCSDVYAIGSILGLNLLQEYFGKESAKQATRICFLLMVFFAFMAAIHLLYQPSSLDQTHDAFFTILSTTPRLLLASLLTFFMVQQVDVRFYQFLRNALPHRSLAFWNLISLVVSQFLDTLLFSFLGLFGLVSSFWDILLLSFGVKLLIILFMVPALSLVKRYAHD